MTSDFFRIFAAVLLEIRKDYGRQQFYRLCESMNLTQHKHIFKNPNRTHSIGVFAFIGIKSNNAI